MTQAEKDARIEKNLAFIKDQSESLRDNPHTYPHESIMKAMSIVMAAIDCELIAGTPSDEKLKEWGARPAKLNTHESGGIKCHQYEILPDLSSCGVLPRGADQRH